MAGTNRYSAGLRQPLGKFGTLAPAPAKPCVFISHKKDDADMARAVAVDLREMNVDVWLDLSELDMGEPSSPEEHRRLTEAIETGVQNSTHLLALITTHTRTSWWVPFEIGSCRALQKGIAFLIHRDEAIDPPSYMGVGVQLADRESLYRWAEKLNTPPGVVCLEMRTMTQLLKPSGLDKYIPSRKWR